jgi:hypothetical protein
MKNFKDRCDPNKVRFGNSTNKVVCTLRMLLEFETLFACFKGPQLQN